MLNTAILSIGANAMRSSMTYLSLHSEVPDSGGSDETGTRHAASWAPSTDGDLAHPSVTFTGGPPNGPVKAVGFWNAGASGNYFGYYPVDGDQIFNGSGQYTLNPFTLVGSSS